MVRFQDRSMCLCQKLDISNLDRHCIPIEKSVGTTIARSMIKITQSTFQWNEILRILTKGRRTREP